jgi:hypothetical protein
MLPPEGVFFQHPAGLIVLCAVVPVRHQGSTVT